MESKRRLILLALAVAAALAIYLRLSGKAPEGGVPEKNQMTLEPAMTVPSPSPTLVPVPSPVADRKSRAQQGWAVFKTKFGEGLTAEFGDEGFARSVRIAPGNRKGVSGFDPKDPRKAVNRAREVLDAAREMIGLSDDLPLSEPTVQTSEDSAQVSFQEMMGGVPFAPYGKLTVDLNQNGELLGLNSSYLPNVRITNVPKIGGEEARKAALGAVGNERSPFKPEGGRHLLWVTSYRSGQAEAKHAYEFFVSGRQVVIDAQTREAILVRDRRHR